MSVIGSSSMIKTGLIGRPVTQSLSPLIHNHWIKHYNLEGAYKAHDMSPDTLEKEVQALVEAGYAGFNVTLPHKESIIALCDEIDETARAIGAVNTVKIEQGRLTGTNTDAYGFIESIKTDHPDYVFNRGPALVLGAGGAARAVIYALLSEGVPQIKIANRTRERADTIRNDFKSYGDIEIVSWDERAKHLDSMHMLVNTSSLGMEGKSPLDINLQNLPREALVIDIVYKPLMTGLLMMAQKRGNNIVTGIGMLLHQARPAFKTWYGVLPAVDRELMKKVNACMSSA